MSSESFDSFHPFGIQVGNVGDSLHIPRFEGPRHKASVFALADAAMRLAHQEKEIEEGRVDPVTGLRNRLVFENELSASIATAAPGDLSVFFVDLDGLKRVNDVSYATGDGYLRLVADSIVDTVRPYDMVARIGGDEVGIILDRRNDDPNDADKRPAGYDLNDLTNLAVMLGDRVDQKIDERDELAVIPKLGLSIGWATLEPGDSAEDLVERAGLMSKAHKAQRYDDVQGAALRAADPRLNP